MTATTWHVRVDTTAPPLNEARVDHILDALADLRPSLVQDTADLTITLHIAAATLRQAIATALTQVETAIGTKAVGVEAITTHEVNRRLTQPQIPDLVGHAEIAELLGVSRQRAAQLATRADFPPAVVTTKAGPLRVLDQVTDWAKTWDRKNGRPRLQR